MKNYGVDSSSSRAVSPILQPTTFGSGQLQQSLLRRVFESVAIDVNAIAPLNQEALVQAEVDIVANALKRQQLGKDGLV